MDRKIILFELNEVPMTIVDAFVAWQPESILAERLPQCHRYVTRSEDQTALTPWRTWPSLHRGVTDVRHGVLEFGQDLREADGEFPPVWRLLTRHGVTTGICGSLHSYPMPTDLEAYAFYLPDAFAAGSECFPTTLSTFQELNLTMARASARNVSKKVPWGVALRMLRTAPELGLRAASLSDVGRQLVSERLHGWRRVRRRTYQAVLAFDVFMKQLVETRPDFCTFFTNHVASSMHRYWAATFPDDYEENLFDERWIGRFRNEIEFAMSKCDELLRRLVHFVDAHPDHQLWIATSMGQEATTTQPVETQLYVTDVAKLMQGLGLGPGTWERLPAMLPQVNVRVTERYVPRLRSALAELRIDGRALDYDVASGGLVSMTFGHVDLPRQRQVDLGPDRVSLASLGLENVEIEDGGTACAYHVPEGCLLIYDPRSPGAKVDGPPISTLDIAPALLRNYSVEVPSYMNRGVALA